MQLPFVLRFYHAIKWIKSIVLSDASCSKMTVKMSSLVKPEAYNPDTYKSPVAELGFFREPIKIDFLI